MKKFAYAWITLGFFLTSLALHWFFGWKRLSLNQSSTAKPRRLPNI